jgi:hypothetical protein
MTPTNLPTLTGSDKQVAWATEIRTATLAGLVEVRAKVLANIKAAPEFVAEAGEAFDRMVASFVNRRDASFWIGFGRDAEAMWTDSRIPETVEFRKTCREIGARSRA